MRKYVGRYGVKTRIEWDAKVRYYFYKWFSVLEIGTIPPYYLRHNRFSKLAMAGASDRELRQLKGSKTFKSIEPYIHLSTEKARKLARIIE